MQRTADVVITKFENGWANGKEVVLFAMAIKIGNEQWELMKRYSDFHDLNEKLHTSHVKLPPFPPKSFFTLKTKEDLEKRRDGLENYIRDVASRLEFYSEPLFIDFIELKQNQPSFILNELEMKHKFSHILMGYRDVYFSPSRKYYFTACADQNALSRIDSYISNFSFPWDKTKAEDKSLPVGTLECWAKIDETNQFGYEKLWIKHLTSQCICISFSEELTTVAVGCDDGSITFLKLSVESPTKFEQYSKVVHSARVMSLSFNSAKNLLYSIGEDKCIKVFDLKRKEVTYELACSQSKPTNMAVDTPNEIAYVVDRAGSMAIVTLATNPPSFKQSVKICADGHALRAIDVDFDSGLIHVAAIDNGTIYVLKILERNNPEAKLKRIVEISGAPFARVLKYCPETRDIFVGHFNGILSVVNEGISDKGPVFVAKVHLDNINQIQILNEGKNIVTASNDKSMKVGII